MIGCDFQESSRVTVFFYMGKSFPTRMVLEIENSRDEKV